MMTMMMMMMMMMREIGLTTLQQLQLVRQLWRVYEKGTRQDKVNGRRRRR
jgi:hypothetical protein